MKKILTLIFIAALITLGIYFGLKNNNLRSSDNEKLHVVASFYPYYFFASEIGGDKVQVTNITPAGAEPHDYEPTSGDLVQISSSKLLILNGQVEPWGTKIQTDLKDKNTAVLIAGQGLFTQKITDEEGKTGIDPHIWLSPMRAKLQVKAILDEFINIDPANKNYYSDNSNALLTKLDKVDADFKKGLASCKKKNIVTSHAAFGYLASDYNLTQTPIAGLSPDAEPSLRDMAKITNFVKANGIKYIFFESLVSPKLSQTVAASTGAQTLILDPLEGLRPEAIMKGENYLTVMSQNLHNLRIALECQ
ncbi:MAG TPA: zinc ABC transporter substrate-binding protein [Patescibacteria group bacterium]|nr:zinc ABC transporter substrate-binding protein [Patescibacteria group bacterium]